MHAKDKKRGFGTKPTPEGRRILERNEVEKGGNYDWEEKVCIVTKWSGTC